MAPVPAAASCVPCQPLSVSDTMRCEPARIAVVAERSFETTNATTHVLHGRYARRLAEHRSRSISDFLLVGHNCKYPPNPPVPPLAGLASSDLTLFFKSEAQTGSEFQLLILDLLCPGLRETTGEQQQIRSDRQRTTYTEATDNSSPTLTQGKKSVGLLSSRIFVASMMAGQKARSATAPADSPPTEEVKTAKVIAEVSHV